MFGRVLVVVSIIDPDLVLKLLLSIGTMTGTATLAGVFLWIYSSKLKHENTSGSSSEVVLMNPFSLAPALKFALFFIAILITAKAGQIFLGDKGLYLASMVSGLADVDAITLSIAEQTKNGSILLDVGARGITIAVVANSVVKSGIAFYSGGLRFGTLVTLILMGSTCAGLGVLFLL